MKSYQNYLFDLYGTLLDISTDEHKSGLWKTMAGFYNVYGCDWDKKRIDKAFWKTDAEERRIKSKENGKKMILVTGMVLVHLILKQVNLLNKKILTMYLGVKYTLSY